MSFWNRLRVRWQGKALSRSSQQLTNIKGSVSAFGETRDVSLKIEDDGTVAYTLDELSNMVIRCAWCGNPIFPGDPITLYSPDEGFQIPDYAVVYNQDPLMLVGCLLWDCADTGADRGGFWVPDETKPGHGKVHRVLSALEQIHLNMQRGDESPIIIHDITDMGEAIRTSNEALRKCQE